MHALPGRPREFTHKKREELINHIGQGATVEQAAKIVGVTLRTVQREAKHNEDFDHDLQLAVHAAPTDPHQLVRRAARTHWRAAAWLLERSDPDQFAKRPPNSCSPETLMDVCDWLIEKALEKTPAEHREAVYLHTRAAADKALDVLMPNQHIARRRMTKSLAERPMPLSSEQFAKTIPVLLDRDPSKPALLESPSPLPRVETKPWEPPQIPRWRAPNGFKRQDSEELDAEWRYPTPEEEDAYFDALHARADARDAARAEARALKEAAARKKSERAKSLLDQQEKESLGDRLRKAFPLTAARPTAPTVTPPTVAPHGVESPPADKTETPAAAGPAPPTPPDGGIIAREMSAATKPPATEGPPASEGDPALRATRPFQTLLAQIRARRKQPPIARTG